MLYQVKREFNLFEYNHKNRSTKLRTFTKGEMVTKSMYNRLGNKAEVYLATN